MSNQFGEPLTVETRKEVVSILNCDKWLQATIDDDLVFAQRKAERYVQCVNLLAGLSIDEAARLLEVGRRVEEGMPKAFKLGSRVRLTYTFDAIEGKGVWDTANQNVQICLPYDTALDALKALGGE